MKLFFVILTLILAKVSFCQVSDNYKDIPGLRTVYVLNTLQLAGTFKCDAGFEGAIMKLDSSGKFDNYLYSCDGKEPVDSGNWQSKGNQISLSGIEPVKYFDILQFKEYYILVPHENKEQFIKEIKSTIKKVNPSTLREYDFAGYVLDKLSVIVYIKKASARTGQ